MQQRDLLKEEAERLGKVLGKLTALLLGTARGPGGTQAVQMTNADLTEAIKLDVPYLLLLDKPALQEYLKAQDIDVAGYSPLADYLEAAGNCVVEERERYLVTAEYVRQLRDEELGEIPLFRI